MVRTCQRCPQVNSGRACEEFLLVEHTAHKTWYCSKMVRPGRETVLMEETWLGGLGLGVGGREKGNATNRTLLSWFYISMPSHTYSPFAKPIYRQLWDYFETTLKQLWGNFEETLRQFWDNFETTLGQLWDNFETTRNIYETILRQLRDNLETFQTILSICIF